MYLLRFTLGLVVFGHAAFLFCHAQTRPLLEPGMAVTTHFARLLNGAPDPNDDVIRIIDLRNPPAGDFGKNWHAPVRYSPNGEWAAKRLGSVFGIALDDTGHIYVAAMHDVHWWVDWGFGGPGAIYKIHPVTGAVNVFAQLPNSGPGLGNLCFDEEHRQMFATNLEDGRIYRLGMDGKILSYHDPRRPDNKRDGSAPKGERLWAVGVYENRVYYSAWWSDQRDTLRTQWNEIRSIMLDGEGEFIPGSDRTEVWIEPHLGHNSRGDTVRYSHPVADIAFTRRGKMLAAERPMLNDSAVGGWYGGIFEYTIRDGRLSDPRIVGFGAYADTVNPVASSRGGVSYGHPFLTDAESSGFACDGSIWLTADPLLFPSDSVPWFSRGIAGISVAEKSGIAGPRIYIDDDADRPKVNRAEQTPGDIEVFQSRVRLQFDRQYVTRPYHAAVPVVIEEFPGAAAVRRIIVSFTYRADMLELVNGNNTDGSLTKGTLLEGWTVNVLENAPGYYAAEFRSEGLQPVDRPGILFRPELRSLHDNIEATPMYAECIFPDEPGICVETFTTLVPQVLCDYRMLRIFPGSQADGSDALITPDHPEGLIEYSLGQGGSDAEIAIYDPAGRLVERLVDGYQEGGSYRLLWETSGYSSGVYYCRLASAYCNVVRKIVLVK